MMFIGLYSEITLFEGYNHGVFKHRFAVFNVDGSDFAITSGTDCVLHFHCLKHRYSVGCFYSIANFDVDREDYTGEGSFDGIAACRSGHRLGNDLFALVCARGFCRFRGVYDFYRCRALMLDFDLIGCAVDFTPTL